MIDHLSSPQLVLLYEAINVATSDSLYLVLEYVPGGTVIDVKVGGKPTKALDVEISRSYFRQMTLGLEYLHSAGVTHRDIKVGLQYKVELQMADTDRQILGSLTTSYSVPTESESSSATLVYPRCFRPETTG